MHTSSEPHVIYVCRVLTVRYIGTYLVKNSSIYLSKYLLYTLYTLQCSAVAQVGNGVGVGVGVSGGLGGQCRAGQGMAREGKTGQKQGRAKQGKAC